MTLASVVNRHKEFARSYNVEFLTPVYDFGSREERRAKLSELGFDTFRICFFRGAVNGRSVR